MALQDTKKVRDIKKASPRLGVFRPIWRVEKKVSRFEF